MNADMLRWHALLKKLCIPYKTRSTGALYFRCPFHREKTPSLRVWHDSGRFHCFGCHKDGTLADFVMERFPTIPKDTADPIAEVLGSTRYILESPYQIVFDL